MTMLDDARNEGFEIDECGGDCGGACDRCGREVPDGHPILWEKGKRYGKGYCSLPCLGMANGGNFY